jgi:SSS family solute:Na+ symporter
MLTGIISAMLMLQFKDAIGLNELQAFPILLGICLLGCFAGTWATPHDDMEVLKSFYLKTRPWGFWGPVREELKKDHPNIKANTNFGRDTFNVLIGIVWQTSFAAIGIFLVIKNWQNLAIAIGVLTVTSLILKFTWNDTLEDYPSDYVPETTN